MLTDERTILIDGRRVGPGEPVYIVAELSANHNGDFDRAVEIVRAAARAGADAIKLQTYTADTLTIDSYRPPFRISGGTLWDDRTLHDLYREAATPWEWQPKLQVIARELGLHCFSTPFDDTATAFLESLDMPAYKIASFEIVDLPLIRRVAQTRRPIIMSTGMATLEEIDEAVTAAVGAGASEIALLKCCSAYPAPTEEMNLRSIPAMAEKYGVPVGLSDHTMDHTAALVSVALGASIIEKHLTPARSDGGADAGFSLEPDEFAAMVDAVRTAERALGEARFGVNPSEEKSRVFRRSLFVVEDVKAGEQFTKKNVRSIRPGFGLHTRHLPELIGCTASRDIPRGTPMAWDLVVEQSGVVTA